MIEAFTSIDKISIIFAVLFFAWCAAALLVTKKNKLSVDISQEREWKKTGLMKSFKKLVGAFQKNPKDDPFTIGYKERIKADFFRGAKKAGIISALSLGAFVLLYFLAGTEFFERAGITFVIFGLFGLIFWISSKLD